MKAMDEAWLLKLSQMMQIETQTVNSLLTSVNEGLVDIFLLCSSTLIN